MSPVQSQAGISWPEPTKAVLICLDSPDVSSGHLTWEPLGPTITNRFSQDHVPFLTWRFQLLAGAPDPSHAVVFPGGTKAEDFAARNSFDFTALKQHGCKGISILEGFSQFVMGTRCKGARSPGYKSRTTASTG